MVRRANKKIKHMDLVNLQSRHKRSKWFECSGQNVCSISECPGNSGNFSNISECEEQQFVVNVTNRSILKDGKTFTLKSARNDTYIYCTRKWCDLLPMCGEGEVESDSENRANVTCHTPTTFYVEKLHE